MNAETGLLEPSVFQFKEKSLNPIGRLILKVYQLLGLVNVETGVNGDGDLSQATNCTLINLALKLMGPLHEGTLTIALLIFQV